MIAHERLSDLSAARLGFLTTIAACLAILVGIHLVPKSFRLADDLRFGYTIAYFVTWMILIHQLMEPRAELWRRLYAWRFLDCPPPMEQAWRQFLHSLDVATKVYGRLTLGFLGTTAYAVIRPWCPGMIDIDWIMTPLWWIATITLVLSPFACGFLIEETLQRRRALTDQLATNPEITPRGFFSPIVENVPNPTSAVVVEADGTFRAGGERWRWEEFTKNVIVFGQVGSGKTLCVMNALLDAFISLGEQAPTGEKPSALILDPKGDYRGKLNALCRRHGRANDLLVLDPRRPASGLRWNPLDSDDDELELAARVVSAMEVLGMKSNETSFWVDSSRKFLRHAIALLRRTNTPGEPPSLAQIGDLISCSESIEDRIQRLTRSDATARPTLAYFEREWLGLPEETRASIQAHVSNMIDPFLMPPYTESFAGRSTLRIGDAIDRGKIVYVDMPLAEREQMGRMVGVMMKLEFFREVRRRVNKQRPSFFVCDEFQKFFTTLAGKGDADEFEITRQSNHANLIATQNLPALLKHAPNRSAVDNLLGNCAIKLFLRNTDRETNQYASDLFGQVLASMPGSNGGAGRMGISRFAVQGLGRSVSTSSQYDSRVRPERFTELAIPCRHDGILHCEAIVHHGARSYVDHRNAKKRWPAHPIVV
jgi:hypothetical protein